MYPRLRSYHFPGNVRELENIVERAVALCSDNIIKLHDLPPNLKERTFNTLDNTLSFQGYIPETIPDGGIDLEKIIGDYEIKLLEKALNKSGGIKKRAAKLLGISFRSMRYRLEKYGLD